jgi:hypothetical protein
MPSSNAVEALTDHHPELHRVIAVAFAKHGQESGRGSLRRDRPAAQLPSITRTCRSLASSGGAPACCWPVSCRVCSAEGGPHAPHSALRIDRDYEQTGATHYPVVVLSGAVLRLSGSLSGDLVVEQGGTAVIDGQVDGDLLCAGTAELNGVLRGNVEIAGTGTFTAATGACRWRDGGWLVMNSHGQWAADAGEHHTVTDATPRWPVTGD